MEQGLASNEINSVAQDKTGFLWIASNSGLQRFDGVKFRTFKHRESDPSSIPSNVIVRLFTDVTDNLWLATNEGEVAIFDKNTFTAKIIPVNVSKPEWRFREIYFIQDEYGNLFLLLRGAEVLQYNKEQGAFISITKAFGLNPAWGAVSFAQQPGTKKYWIGFQTKGMAICNRQTGNTSYYGHNVEHEPAIETLGPAAEVSLSKFDNRGRLWFVRWGTGFPVCMQYDPSRVVKPLQEFEFITELKTYHELHTFMQQRDGRVWIKGVGLFAFFNEAENRFQLVRSSSRSQQGIVYEEVAGLTEDRESSLWVATRSHGLYRFNPSQEMFTNVYHSSRTTKGQTGEGTHMSFMETKNGDLLSGVWEDGLMRYNQKLAEIPLAIKEESKIRYAYIWNMCASADSNTVWMGAQPGLFQYDQKNGTVRYRNPPLMQNRTVRQVVEDTTGTLWLGMHNFGVYRWLNPKSTKKDSLVKVQEPGEIMINKLMADRKGRIWVGSSGKGLFLYDAVTSRLLNHWNGKESGNKAIPGDAIMALLDYSDSVVAIGDLTGLFFYNRQTNTLRRWALPGSFMGNISSIEKDGAGNIWIATTNALYRIHPQKKTAMVYSRTDGMASDRFALSASYRMRDGRLLFAASNSFIVFDPLKTGQSGLPPPVILSGVQVGKKDLRVDSVMALDRLELSAEDNYISVEVSTLRFTDNQLIQYKMDGIDDEWRVADGLNRISYPYLPARRYTLQLRSLNSEGHFSQPTVLAIRVRPPWYQTWWFYTLVAIAFIAELWWLDRQRNLRKRAMQKMRTDIWNNLHKEVNEALNNINILSEIARLKSDREPQKAKEYLEQIHTKSHNMTIAMDDMLWSLDPDNDAMEKTVSRIREYADALMQRHGALIELLIDKKVEKMELNMRLRHEAFLLFKEGLGSLVEAGTRHCIVHLAAERTTLLFTIEFNNDGCNMQQLNNLLQRRDMGLRIQALNAKLDVQLHKSRSMFLLQLPTV
jgi:ligand-binding sensor domain-containing protein/signal transduction histidine kinase